MSMRRAFTVVAVCSLLCGGCSNKDALVEPSPVPSSPQLSGNYTFALTPCDLATANAVLSSSLIGPYTTWTLTQQDNIVTGRYSMSSPPGLSSGTMTGKVDGSGRFTVDALQFTWSSSHVALIQFAAAGGGDADKTQISGTLSGALSSTPTFGGIAGTPSSCSGTRMSFRFTRKD